MGFNTTVLILNDALGQIEADADFGRKLAEVVRRRPATSGDPLADRVSSGGGCAARVIETHHADNTAVVALGGNDATVLGTVFRADHHTPEGRLAILQVLAGDMGYKLVRTSRPRESRAKSVKSATGKPPRKS